MEGVEEESFIEAAYCTARDELGDLDSAGGGAAWSGVDGTGASTSHWRAGRGSQDSPQADTAQNISHVEGCVSYLVRELAAMGERAKTAASLSRELVVCADGPGTVGASAELPIEIRAPIVLDLIVSFIGRHRQRGLELGLSSSLWHALGTLARHDSRVLRSSVARFTRHLLLELPAAAEAEGVTALLSELVSQLRCRTDEAKPTDSLATSATFALLHQVANSTLCS